jgi:hypothetical protein
VAAAVGEAVLVDHRVLLLPGGRQVTLLNGKADIDAVQVGPGWLVTGSLDTDARSLWLVTPDGTARHLVDGVQGEPVVGVGRRVAWRTATQLLTGHLTDTGTTAIDIVIDASTPIPATRTPATFWPVAVTSTAVVLGATATGGGIDSFDAWLPDNGSYVPAWDRFIQVAAVYGPAPV